MDFSLHLPPDFPEIDFQPDPALYELIVVKSPSETTMRFHVKAPEIQDFLDLLVEFIAEQNMPFDRATVESIARSMTLMGIANAHYKTIVIAMAKLNVALMDRETKKHPYDPLLVLNWYNQLGEFLASRDQPTQLHHVH
jgi:hypothetical protein